MGKAARKDPPARLALRLQGPGATKGGAGSAEGAAELCRPETETGTDSRTTHPQNRHREKETNKQRNTTRGRIGPTEKKSAHNPWRCGEHPHPHTYTHTVHALHYTTLHYPHSQQDEYITGTGTATGRVTSQERGQQQEVTPLPSR